ncbi:hypothetical protein [Bacillus atrophaeus]|uniref:hypothetical protein n=1 Tax=Bacillus atrophaeus TaxID=1452 RepID=UPI00404282D5
MNKRFVKMVTVHYFDDAVKKMEEARSLGFILEVKQLREEERVCATHDPAVFEINLYLPTNDEHVESSGKYRVLERVEELRSDVKEKKLQAHNNLDDDNFKIWEAIESAYENVIHIVKQEEKS